MNRPLNHPLNHPLNRSLAITLSSLAVAFALMLAAGCESTSHAEEKKTPMKTAVARVERSKAAATQPSWGNTSGTVTFTEKGDGKVKVVIDLQGVPPGKHGFHIHEKGDLSAADLSSAGGHFNPHKHPHAGPETEMRHAGDFGNVDADVSGNVKKELTVDQITIGTGAADDIVGKSVILHAKADDLKSQPSGDAGGRIAGGVIELKK